MRKRNYMILTAAFCTLAVGSFTSCKDTNEDEYNTLRDQMINGQTTLEELLKAQKAELENAKQHLNDTLAKYVTKEEYNRKMQDLDAAILDLQNKVNDANSANSALRHDLDELKQRIDAIQTCNCAEKWNELNTVTLPKIKSDIEQLQQALDGKVDTTTFNVLKTKFEEHIEEYKQHVIAFNTAKEQLEKADSLINVNINKINSLLNNVYTDGDGNTKDITTAIAELYALANKNKNDIANIPTVDLTDIYNRLQILENKTCPEPEECKFQKYVDEVNAALSKAELADQWFQKALDLYHVADTEYVNSEVKKAIETAERLKAEAIKIAVDSSKNYTDSQILLVNNTINDFKTTVNNRFAEDSVKIAALNDSLDALKLTVADIKDTLEAHGVRLDNIENELKSQISGILVQSTHNPCFGSVALPINWRSNILTAYYGKAVNKVQFPSTSTTSLVGDDNFTAAEIAGVASVDLGSNCMLPEDGKAYAGEIFTTINPSSLNFEGQTLKLVNSKNEQSGITLAPLAYSNDYMVSFGGTRSAENGFYKAEAYLDINKADQNHLNVTKADLKDAASAVKTFIKNRTGLKTMMGELYSDLGSTMNIPAYGLQASYTKADGRIANVTSNYNVAAIAVQPLSYNTLYGKKYNFDRFLSIFDRLKVGTLDGLIHVNHITIDFGELNYTWNDLEVKFGTFTGDDLGRIKVHVEYKYPDPDGFVVDGSTVTHNGKYLWDETDVIIEGNQFDDLADAINANVMSQIENQFAELNGKIHGNMDDLKNSINDLLTNAEVNLNGQLQDAIADINSQISNKANSYINKYNNYINRISNMFTRLVDYIDEPNVFLQPVMVVATNNTYSLVSQSKAYPATFALNGSGDQNVVLYPTSYTGEMLCPAYKKFITCTKVTNPDGSLNEAARAKANGATNMHKVIDGDIHAVEFLTNAAYKGCTYEIAYGALDYSGYKVTKRFYIKVK